MSIDVTCPACGGSIQIEEVAEVVACPLCEKHLQIDPETNEPVLVSEESDGTEVAESESSVTDSESESENAAQEGGEVADESENGDEATEEATETDATITAEENAGLESVHAFAHPQGDHTDDFDLTKTDPEPESASPFSFLPAASGDSGETESEPVDTTEETTDSAAQTETTEEDVPAEDSTEVAESTSEDEPTIESETATEESSAEATAAEETSSEPESQPAPSDYRQPKVVSKRLFTLTLTYAIAATIMIAMLLYKKYLGDPHQLESLPDLKPPVKNDEIALQLVPENAELPPGHTLKLGEPGRRFGNVLVTPLRVTRGPLEFEHYTGDTSKTRAPSEEVLKLYLKFENVSSDQTFEPLDQKLLLTRVSGKTPESQMRANNFVSRVDQKRTSGKRVLTYDMPPSWEWNLKGQNINQEAKPQNLAPGESIETYVATNEAGIDDLKGELVWRLQLRKGYHPKSHRGVTTLIEVVFNSDQIEPESPAESKEESLPTS
ncbi:hypothetical protein [Gimesia fumaroli]|uniref:Uncharacterized protein n=1 Tax=Gimesia fumaroli TaxID=2527976 RepID=A0A518IK15_9PLAN|nr:hypothetical protein [Gimesia fumaroli]QDV53399.1 hypothetical protein Enr17x_54740 [Gimesia fumaroli]